LLVGGDVFFHSRIEHIVGLAARHAIPTMYLVREFVVAGGLISYGTSLIEEYRQVGLYTGRILKGEKPADLPIMSEQRESVKTMAGFGIPHKRIALTVINPRTGRPIDDETLRFAFRRELDLGMIEADTRVCESLFNQAVKGNVPAAIWWTKARLGWKETIQQQMLDQDGNPVRPVLNVIYERLGSSPASEAGDDTRH
jgi:hypothetical protein